MKSHVMDFPVASKHFGVLTTPIARHTATSIGKQVIAAYITLAQHLNSDRIHYHESMTEKMNAALDKKVCTVCFV